MLLWNNFLPEGSLDFKASLILECWSSLLSYFWNTMLAMIWLNTQAITRTAHFKISDLLNSIRAL